MRQSNQVGPNENSKLVPLLLSAPTNFLGFAITWQMLNSYPQLVHFDEIRQHEFIRVLDGALFHVILHRCRGWFAFVISVGGISSVRRVSLWRCFCSRRYGFIGQLVSKGLKKVMTQEQSTDRILHAFYTLDHVLEDPFRTDFATSNQGTCSANLQIQAGQHIRTVLDVIIQFPHRVGFHCGRISDNIAVLHCTWHSSLLHAHSHTSRIGHL